MNVFKELPGGEVDLSKLKLPSSTVASVSSRSVGLGHLAPERQLKMRKEGQLTESEAKFVEQHNPGKT